MDGGEESAVADFLQVRPGSCLQRRYYNLIFYPNFVTCVDEKVFVTSNCLLLCCVCQGLVLNATEGSYNSARRGFNGLMRQLVGAYLTLSVLLSKL